MYIHLCKVFNIKARGPQQTSVLATRWCERDNNSDPHTELVWLSSHTKCFQFYPGYFSFILSSQPEGLFFALVCWSGPRFEFLGLRVLFFIFISSSYFNFLHCLILDSPRSVGSVFPLYFGGCCSLRLSSV